MNNRYNPRCLLFPVLVLHIAALLIHTCLAGQEDLRFRHVSVSHGLSNSSVSCILQDSTGYIWIGTEDGLNRYNGRTIRNYKSSYSDKKTLRNNQISTICLHNEDNFWVGHKKGIDYYDSDLDVFSPVPLTTQSGKHHNRPALTLHKDANGVVLAGTAAGLYQYNPQENRFEKIVVLDDHVINEEEITYITSDRQGNHWVGTLNHGVFRFNINNQRLSEIQHIENGLNTLKGNKVFNIYEDRNSIVWIGSEQGLYKHDPFDQSVIRYTTDTGKEIVLPHRTVSQVFEDKHQRIWILTNAGLCIYDKNRQTFHTYTNIDFDPFSLSCSAPRYIYEDRNGIIWIGTYENGLNILQSENNIFKNITRIPGQEYGLNYAFVLSITEDNDNNLWIGTNGGGINVYNRKENSFSYILPNSDVIGIRSDAINTLTFDNDGVLWIGTYLGGLTRYDPASETHKTYLNDAADSTSISSNIINHVYQDSSDNIWIATNNGLNLYNGQDDSFTVYNNTNSSLPYALTSVFPTVIMEDSKGKLWIGSYYGLNKLDPSTGIIQHFLYSESQNGLSDNSVFAILEDKENRIWVGTAMGLNLYNPSAGCFDVFTTTDGLPNNTINGIQEDSEGYIWISTNNGLSRMDPGSRSFINFDLNDGLHVIEFHKGASHKNKNGELFFGGNRGLITFDPADYHISEANHPVIIEEFYVNNLPATIDTEESPLKKPIRKTSYLKLNHNQSFFGFSFSALNYTSPEKDLYAYKLKGFDSQWIHIGDKTNANYTNIPPGKYEFVTKVKHNNDAVSYSDPIVIQVLPVFWKTRFAYTLYTLLVAALIYFLWNYFYSKTAYKHSLQIERLEKEKIIALNQSKFQFFTNVAHEFKTPLTLILSPIERLINSPEYRNNTELFHKTLKVVYRNTGRLSRLISQIMDIQKIDSGIINLQVSKYDIVYLVREVSENYSEYAVNHCIDYRLESAIDKVEVWIDQDKIEKTIFNLLGNAFKFTPDAGSITITIDRIQKGAIPGGNNKQLMCDEYVKISVADTGSGIAPDELSRIFTRFYQGKDHSKANRASSGIGLSIAREFIELHKGIIRAESTIQKGSTFTIYIPLGHKHFKNEDFVNINPRRNYDKLISKHISQYNEPIIAGQKKESGPTGSKILLAEDNAELKDFILDNLEDEYEVYEAKNGEEALKLAGTVFPNLIISDIMMPEMSGIELCRRIKSNIETCHIPVILITVLNSLENQIDGFESGADDYITKPFNMGLLEVKIRSILKNRMALISKFMMDPRLDIEKLGNNSIDKDFLAKANNIVEKNIDNYDFSIEDFCREIAMSRSRLHVKLKALTNQSCTEFIRMIRLKKAATYLYDEGYNVSEIAYMVGFNNISYFNRCFRKTFGKTPTEFQREKTKDPSPVSPGFKEN